MKALEFWWEALAKAKKQTKTWWKLISGTQPKSVEVLRRNQKMEKQENLSKEHSGWGLCAEEKEECRFGRQVSVRLGRTLHCL
jgi:hypothetical protein